MVVPNTRLDERSDVTKYFGRLEQNVQRCRTRVIAGKQCKYTQRVVSMQYTSVCSLPEDDVIDSSTLPHIGRQRHSTSTCSPVPVNSHLMNQRVLPTNRCSSMADLRLTETEIKSRIMLAHIMDELGQ